MGKKTVCPLCGVSYEGLHVCKGQYSEDLLEPAPKKEKKVVTSEGEVFRQSPNVADFEYGICENCLKLRNMKHLHEIEIPVPIEFTFFTGEHTKKALICTSCLRQADESPIEKEADKEE